MMVSIAVIVDVVLLLSCAVANAEKVPARIVRMVAVAPVPRCIIRQGAC